MKRKRVWFMVLLSSLLLAAALLFAGCRCDGEDEDEDQPSQNVTGSETKAPSGSEDATKTPSGSEDATKAPADASVPYLDQAHLERVTNEDGSTEYAVIAPVKLPPGVEFSDVFIFKGDSTAEKDMIAIQTAQKDVDVMYNPQAESDGWTWCKFAGRVYWFDKDPNEVLSPDDTITIVVNGFANGKETGYSNKITGKVKDLLLK